MWKSGLRRKKVKADTLHDIKKVDMLLIYQQVDYNLASSVQVT